MGRARAHFGWIPDCSLKKTCPSVVHSKFSVMHYFKFTFSREMRSAKLSDTWRFEKGISWDSSQGEDTNLIPKNKNFGETKISYVRFYRLSCFDNVGLFFI